MTWQELRNLLPPDRPPVESPQVERPLTAFPPIEAKPRAQSPEPRAQTPKSSIDTPALLIDLDILDRNIAKMAAFFEALDLFLQITREKLDTKNPKVAAFFENAPAKLRPHAKTHKSPQIAHRQIEAGAIGITCAKLGEAEALAKGGIQDILVANQIVGPEKARRLAALTAQAKITVALDDPRNADELSSAATEAGAEIGVLIEVDVGLGRCGVPPGDPALSLAKYVARKEGLTLRGLMGYEGHIIFLEDPAARRREVRKSMNLLVETARLLRKHNLPAEVLSAGGTGTYDLTASHPGITEIQAGSYIFMDSTYLKVRPEFEPSLTVLTTVISRPTKDRAVTDSGRKAISHDFGLPQPFRLPGVELVSLAEEHAKLALHQGAPDLQPGQKIELLPTHCCTTVNLHDQYFVLRSGLLHDLWPIAARGKFT